jgi:hypothetical protein
MDSAISLLGAKINYETLYWLFSTVAQAYAAVVGVMGLLVVYRLESESRVRDTVSQRVLRASFAQSIMKPPLRFVDIFGRQASGWSADDMADKFQKPNDIVMGVLRTLVTPDYDYLLDEMKRISNSRGVSKRIQRSFRNFFGFHLIFIILFIVGIFFTHKLSSTACWIYSVFGFSILLFVISLWLTGILARDIIRTAGKRDLPFIDPLDQ